MNLISKAGEPSFTRLSAISASTIRVGRRWWQRRNFAYPSPWGRKAHEGNTLSSNITRMRTRPYSRWLPSLILEYIYRMFHSTPRSTSVSLFYPETTSFRYSYTKKRRAFGLKYFPPPVLTLRNHTENLKTYSRKCHFFFHFCLICVQISTFIKKKTVLNVWLNSFMNMGTWDNVQ